MAESDDTFDRLEHDQLYQPSLYSFQNPAFEGEFEFDVQLRVLGHSFTRRLKATYRHTPEWEYFDLKKGTLHTSNESWSVGLSLLAVPEPWSDPLTPEDIAAGHEPEEVDPPHWVETDLTNDGMLPRAVWDEIERQIDLVCKAEDARRRRAAR